MEIRNGMLHPFIEYEAPVCLELAVGPCAPLMGSYYIPDIRPAGDEPSGTFDY